MPVDVVGLTQRHPGAPQTLLRHELGGGLLRKTQRVVVGGGARGRTPIGGRTARHAAVDEKQMPAGTHLEGEAAGLRIASDRKRGRRPDVDDNDARSTREPRIARSPRLARQRRSGVTISDDRSQPSGGGSADAVEARQHAVSQSEEAQHRQQARQHLDKLGGDLRLRAAKHWLSGNRSSSSSTRTSGLRLMWPPSGRICRRSSATSVGSTSFSWRFCPATDSSANISAMRVRRRG